MGRDDSGSMSGEEETPFEEDVPLMAQLDEREKSSREHAKAVIVLFSILLVLFVVASVIVTILVVLDIVNLEDDEDDGLVGRITSSNIRSHLESLQSIALDHDDSRAVNLGFNDSQAYVVSQLKKYTNYDLTIQPFSFEQTVPVSPPKMWQVAPGPKGDVVFVEEADFTVLRDSGSGNLTAEVHFVGLGCNSTDYENFPAGAIALCERGICSNLERVNAAINASASAVLIFNYATESEPTASSVGAVVDLPCVGITYTIGELLRATDPNPEVHVDVQNRVQTTHTSNLIADTTTGDPNSVIVVGAHLDSVPVGPGLNDDGSGTSTILELAIQMFKMKLKTKSRVRFAWWSAEELGLKGSSYYVSNLLENDPKEFDKIVMDLNFDMLGSPNYFRALMDGVMCPDEIRVQCVTIMTLFGDYFEQQKLPFTFTPLNNRSDHGPFLDAGKPVGGLKAGAEQIKTEEQRTVFGGYANTNLDPCYHKHCDNIDNVNMEILEQFAKAAAYVLETTAMESDLRAFLEKGTDKKLMMQQKRGYDPETWREQRSDL